MVVQCLPGLDFRAALNPSTVSADVVLAGSLWWSWRRMVVCMFNFKNTCISVVVNILKVTKEIIQPCVRRV
jgi:hypothetical protein